jgi:hypothetical protein
MFNPEKILLIDIETVPAFSDFNQLPEKMQLLWQKKSTLIAQEEDPAEAYEKRAGIYAEFGKIVCIGLGFFIKENIDYTLRIKSISHHDEKLLLQDFAAICDRFFGKNTDRFFCGHNIKEFDIPYICRRSLIREVRLPYVLHELQNKKPWENPMIDTLQWWKFGEYKNFVSIDLLAAVLGIDSPKDDIDGSEVAAVYWKENNLPRIASYCSRDVATVAQVLFRLHEKKLLTSEQIQYID